VYFPLSGVSISPVLLAGVGFLVGVLGGFFGVGGGFIAGPLMYLAGVPINFVVGTDLAHMTGKSIVASRRHRALGHVDIKLGLIMVIGTVVGVEVGARTLVWLVNVRLADRVIGLTYIVILLIISGFTVWESTRALNMMRIERLPASDAVSFGGVSHNVRHLKVPPIVSFPHSGIDAISVWAVLGVGFVSGLSTGVLGVGGGFIRMPLLVYVLGMPTHVAVGTDLFEIVISSGFGTLTHALKGNVDVLMAMVMHTGAALGAQIGASLTRYFQGPRIRLIFAGLPLVGAVLMVLRLLGLMHF
jgi:uncharacterized membrane protein YfcA